MYYIIVWNISIKLKWSYTDTSECNNKSKWTQMHVNVSFVFFIIENAQQVAVDVCENRAKRSAKFVSVPHI